MFPLRHPTVPLLAVMCLSLGCSAVTGGDLGMVSVKTGSMALNRAAAAAAVAPGPIRVVQTTDGIPTVTVSPVVGRQILVNLASQAPGFKAKAVTKSVSGDVTFFRVELIVNQGTSAGTNYSTPTLTAGGFVLASVAFDGPSATVVTGGTVISDTIANSQFAFANVPAGTYRVRIKAYSDAALPGSTVINKPDAFFTNASGWALSTNTATVPVGTSPVTYSSSTALTTPINLNDGGDPVQVGLSVSNGVMPTVTSSDN